MHLGTSLALGMSLFVLSPARGADPTPHHAPQVLFVCEHGNAKSLMATVYFNQLAEQKGLPIRAVARGTAPNSDPISPAITEGLRKDGFDAADFHPTRIRAEETRPPRRVILIGTELPTDARSPDARVESWTDVPPASVDYAASRQALMLHVQDLIAEFERSTRK